MLTALSLLGFHMGFTAYLGEGEDIVAIYDRKSRTPFTGLVPAYLAERVSALNGVLASSPEAIAPCIIKGESIFLRRIIPARADVLALLDQPVNVSFMPDVERGEVLVDSRGRGSFQR